MKKQSEYVYHKTYGVGKVIDLDFRYITVDFKGQTKKFVFPSCMDKFLKYVEDPSFVIVDGVLLKYTGTDSNVVVPDDVFEIGNEAFLDNDNIISISFENHITKIGESAFENCHSLKRVVNVRGLKKIEPRAFQSCSDLSHMYIPETVTDLGGASFNGCSSITTIHIPKGIYFNNHFFSSLIFIIK